MNNETTGRIFFYPDNLSGQILLFMWSFLDLGIMVGLLAVSLVLSMFARFYLGFVSIIIYGFLSAKLSNGYSIVKIGRLYIRFLITDQLKFKWRR